MLKVFKVSNKNNRATLKFDESYLLTLNKLSISTHIKFVNKELFHQVLQNYKACFDQF